MEKIAGVYMIQSISKPERIYVGSTSNDINIRWRQHLSQLKYNRHHSPQLQNHYNAHGKEDLAFDIIESGDYVNEMHLLAREQMWINRYHFKNTDKPFFNASKYAGNAVPCTEERKAILRVKMKGINTWSEGNTNAKGHTISEEVLDKFFRVPMSEEHKQACRHSHAKMSEETKSLPNYFQKSKIPWNKGLSKTTDNRVLAQSITQTGLESPMKGRKYTKPSPLKGRKTGPISAERKLAMKGKNLGNTNASGKRSLEFQEACKQHKMPDNKGRKATQEARHNQSISHIGNASPMKGKHLSPETEFKKITKLNN